MMLNNIFISVGCIGGTILVFAIFKKLQKTIGALLLNPVLLSVGAIICVIKFASIDFDVYKNASEPLIFMLKPAVVALGLPLYLQLSEIKRLILPILISQLIGCVVGIVTVVAISSFLGGEDLVVVSLAPKSVTAPIAMEVSAITGGIPSLTAAVVVCVGLFGAIFGNVILRFTRIKSPIAQGLSIGAASHAVGTSEALTWGKRYGAFSTVALIINGLFTAIIAPYILNLLGYR